MYTRSCIISTPPLHIAGAFLMMWSECEILYHQYSLLSTTCIPSGVAMSSHPYPWNWNVKSNIINTKVHVHTHLQNIISSTYLHDNHLQRFVGTIYRGSSAPFPSSTRKKIQPTSGDIYTSTNRFLMRAGELRWFWRAWNDEIRFHTIPPR